VGRGYRTLGSGELLAHLAAPEAEAAPAVVVTFDDGYASLARHAFPVLADLGLKALVFVITDFVGRDNSWDVQYGWRRFAHLDWDALGVWGERGIEVHSHGATHARLTWLSDAEIGDELGRSREEIGRRLGAPPLAVSYPFGSADERVGRLAEAAGYRLGLSGPLARGADPLRMPRLPVYGWDSFATPLVMAGWPLSVVGMALARFTNRCGVGTAAIQRLLGRRYGS
jgi:peptidoglycan/xylan/chitin deacetylase (PgdA/CDA1 family)